MADCGAICKGGTGGRVGGRAGAAAAGGVEIAVGVFATNDLRPPRGRPLLRLIAEDCVAGTSSRISMSSDPASSVAENPSYD